MLIGINGGLGSGKDTVCKMLQEHVRDTNGLVVKREGFADRLKLSAAFALGFKPASVEEAVKICNKIKETGFILTAWDEGIVPSPRRHSITGREFLQFYGTEAHRDVFTYDFWIRAVLPDPQATRYGRTDDFDVLVIADVRFDNECDAVHEAGGFVWNVDRPQKNKETHVSEKPLPPEKIDYVIKNHGNLDYLRDEVKLAWRSTLKEIYNHSETVADLVAECN